MDNSGVYASRATLHSTITWHHYQKTTLI